MSNKIEIYDWNRDLIGQRKSWDPVFLEKVEINNWDTTENNPNW